MTSITIKPFKTPPIANTPFLVFGIYNGDLPLKYNDAPGPTFKYSLNWAMTHQALPPGVHNITVIDRTSGANATRTILIPGGSNTLDEITLGDGVLS